jgi:hypothetical protein
MYVVVIHQISNPQSHNLPITKSNLAPSNAVAAISPTPAGCRSFYQAHRRTADARPTLPKPWTRGLGKYTGTPPPSRSLLPSQPACGTSALGWRGICGLPIVNRGVNIGKMRGAFTREGRGGGVYEECTRYLYMYVYFICTPSRCIHTITGGELAHYLFLFFFFFFPLFPQSNLARYRLCVQYYTYVRTVHTR